MVIESSHKFLLLTMVVILCILFSYFVLLFLSRLRKHSLTAKLMWITSVVMGCAIGGLFIKGMPISILLVIFISWGILLIDRKALNRMAYYDVVTGLGNRNKMNSCLQSYTGKDHVGIFFVDLDQFKAVNDTLGHHIGDLLVTEVGTRLQAFAQRGRDIFRNGGDEFVFIVHPIDEQQCLQLAAQILQELKRVYCVDEHELHVTASIGICIGKIEKEDPLRLLRNADIAMYQAKKLGKNQYCLYTAELGKREMRKLELEKDMHRAITSGQFYVEYQPKWNLKDNNLQGFEALTRWNHTVLGIVSPLEFIPIAEDTGQIEPLTSWVLEEVCKQCRDWEIRGMKQPVSVNLSVRLFQSGNLVDMIRDKLVHTKLSPFLLELEITETMVLYNVEEIVRQLREIRRLGVKISVDDFGTGYSSIGLLDRLPIDALKLDRLFTHDIETQRKREIIHAIVHMAEKLGLEVVAEGVENEEHIDFLMQLGCFVMQGYYYGKPMKKDHLEQWMEQRNVYTPPVS